MYSYKVRTIKNEQYTCDACEKTAEFTTEWARENRMRDADRVVDPDKGGWGIVNALLSFDGKDFGIEATYCCEEHKDRALRAAMLRAHEKKD
jgi:hypothetical protein